MFSFLYKYHKDLDFYNYIIYIIINDIAMVTKIFLFILVFAILNVLREAIKFIQAMREEKPNMTNGRLVGLGLSIAYIVTIIITGLTL